jgi:hypothetical protein
MREKTRAYGETIRVEVRKEYTERRAALYAPRASENNDAGIMKD